MDDTFFHATRGSLALIVAYSAFHVILGGTAFQQFSTRWLQPLNERVRPTAGSEPPTQSPERADFLRVWAPYFVAGVVTLSFGTVIGTGFNIDDPQAKFIPAVVTMLAVGVLRVSMMLFEGSNPNTLALWLLVTGTAGLYGVFAGYLSIGDQVRTLDTPVGTLDSSLTTVFLLSWLFFLVIEGLTALLLLLNNTTGFRLP